MKNLLIGLSAAGFVVAVSVNATFASASLDGQSSAGAQSGATTQGRTSARARTSTRATDSSGRLVRGPIALTANECEHLGGRVEDNTACGGTGGKQCVTVTPDYAGVLRPHNLCIARSQ